MSTVGRAVATVLSVPISLNYSYHSLKRQIMALPLNVTLKRAAQVLKGESPLIDPFHNAETWLIVLLNKGNGRMDVQELGHESLLAALEKQGIQRIVVKDFAPLTFGTDRAMIIIKRATAGMSEGKTYTFCLNGWWDIQPEYMSMVRHGSGVTVTLK